MSFCRLGVVDMAKTVGQGAGGIREYGVAFEGKKVLIG